MVDTNRMRMKLFFVFNLLVVSSLAFADEKLAVLRTGNDVYTNVSVFNVTATDVYFIYTRSNRVGMANVKLKNLDPALQKHFNYNPTNALAVEQKQARDNTQYHAYLVGHPAPPPPNTDRAAPSAAAPAAPALWRMDLPGALSQARSENKLVLLDFTGSDWCPWCIKFDQEVLSTSQFAGYAGKNLELVKVDFPRHTPLPADQQRANDALAKQFNVDGFPTYVLLDSAGKELGRQVGYREGGPNAFIAELDAFSKR